MKGMAVVGGAMSALLFSLLCGSAAFAAQPPSLQQAGALIDKGEYKAAIALLDSYLEQDPKNAKALTMRAGAKDEIDDEQGAYADFTAAIAINPQYEFAYSGRCGVDTELDHLQAAVDDCTKALTLSHDDDFAYRSRSYAYFSMGDYELASADAEQAVAIDKNDGWNILARCRADVALRRLSSALPACNSAIALLPNVSTPFFFRARIAYLNGDDAAAAADFHKALQIDPSSDTSHYWLAVIAVRQKRFNEAISEADAYLANNANDADSLLVRAQAEKGLGKLDAAKYDAGQALRQYQIANDTDGMKNAQAFLDSLK